MKHTDFYTLVQDIKRKEQEEAENAINAGLLTSPTAHQALGYKIIARYLNGEFDLAKLEELIITATWQYARRQQTWFRHQHPELKPLICS